MKSRGKMLIVSNNPAKTREIAGNTVCEMAMAGL